jgi:ABC-type Zn2+ transport system substrate-binding protein/surface adhesin
MSTKIKSTDLIRQPISSIHRKQYRHNRDGSHDQNNHGHHHRHHQHHHRHHHHDHNHHHNNANKLYQKEQYLKQLVLSDNKVLHDISIKIKKDCIAELNISFIVINLKKSNTSVKKSRHIIEYANKKLKAKFEYVDEIEYLDVIQFNGISYRIEGSNFIVSVSNVDNEKGYKIKWIVKFNLNYYHINH